MQKKKRIWYVKWILVIVWMGIIFSFSAKEADESTQMSLRVGKMISAVVVPGYNKMELQKQEAFAEKIDFAVRKSAHMSEYAILAVLLLFALSEAVQKIRLTFLIGVAYASSDEFHQLFVRGRSGQIRDVCIDSIGIIVVLVFYYIGRRIVKAYLLRKDLHLCK